MPERTNHAIHEQQLNYIFLTIALLAALVLGACQPSQSITTEAPSQKFDGQRAYQDVVYQTNLGPRLAGTEAHTKIRAWINQELTNAGWTVEEQNTTYFNQPVINVIAKSTPTIDPNRPWIILGAHYDSRMVSDQDPDPAKHLTPVPGANDGASGVAVLVELGRTLPKDIEPQVWLVFFDAEDNGELPGYDWILGSQAFVESLQGKPEAAVVVDMIGDADLNIYYEKNSDQQLSESIFNTAASLGYTKQFVPEPRFRMLDDHLPFVQAGIRAVDLIDFDYPYWHTTSDTADKVSAESLMAVGDTLSNWLQNQPLAVPSEKSTPYP
jgi:glutaminyl-peptide cyclotransferase